MNTLGNLIWLIFGGLFSAIGYFIVGLIFCLTIIGIPFGIQCFKIGEFVLWPFGRIAITSPKSQSISVILNIIWIIFGGIWLALSHIIFGLILFITIIGIPFARQHFKLVEISLMPFGKEIINK